MRVESGRKVLYLANVGDSRGILISGSSSFERLSYDHRATDRAEIERVKRDGGMIMDSRVAGSLAVTRAFGDHALKRDGVTARPHLRRVVLKPTDKFLVMGSDGIWDVLEDEHACKLCREQLTTKEIA